ncbi:hypothetical protein RF11_10670 [Thelohanellus kitauei]|uniref:Uncharacterized protein n=1 Tax=Thelohanellus kitauei TaxID=669202 RepID=A0A0C2M3Q2_THEKT|nr:hypothetical protein RF11_10670 [Thelohanellus kitauei]
MSLHQVVLLLFFFRLSAYENVDHRCNEQLHKKLEALAKSASGSHGASDIGVEEAIVAYQRQMLLELYKLKDVPEYGFMKKSCNEALQTHQPENHCWPVTASTYACFVDHQSEYIGLLRAQKEVAPDNSAKSEENI